MEETMRDVQLKLARQCVSKLSRVPARRLRADENFAVRKRNDISRTTLIEKLSM